MNSITLLLLRQTCEAQLARGQEETAPADPAKELSFPRPGSEWQRGGKQRLASPPT